MKDKKIAQKLTGMAGFLTILMLYIMRHSSNIGKLEIYEILTIITLFMFVGTICIPKYRKLAVMAFLFLLLGATLIFTSYSELKNIDNNFGVIIIPILITLGVIESYRIVAKTGNIEAIKVVRKNAIIFFILMGVILLIVATIYIYNLINGI
jgi:hypothetical protein